MTIDVIVFNTSGSGSVLRASVKAMKLIYRLVFIVLINRSRDTTVATRITIVTTFTCKSASRSYLWQRKLTGDSARFCQARSPTSKRHTVYQQRASRLTPWWLVAVEKNKPSCSQFYCRREIWAGASELHRRRSLKLSPQGFNCHRKIYKSWSPAGDH